MALKPLLFWRFLTVGFGMRVFFWKNKSAGKKYIQVSEKNKNYYYYNAIFLYFLPVLILSADEVV